jgi:hypothetical protein
VLVSVDEQVDGEPRLHGGNRVADTPARRQAAPWATDGTGANDASSHETIPGDGLYDREMIVPADGLHRGQIFGEGAS